MGMLIGGTRRIGRQRAGSLRTHRKTPACSSVRHLPCILHSNRRQFLPSLLPFLLPFWLVSPFPVILAKVPHILLSFH